MDMHATNDPLVHSYDTERHEVRCGVRQQSSSTKHASSVTCPECLRLLGQIAHPEAGRG